MTNIEWLKDIFSQAHLTHVPLEESQVVRWFYIKHGRAYFNPRQAAIAAPLEFMLEVLEIMYNNLGQLKKPL